MRTAMLTTALGCALLGALVWNARAETTPASPATTAILAEMKQRVSLKPVASFDSIASKPARSVALFQEVGKVIESPRCANCHPANHPAQSDDRHLHVPVVSRGADGHGDGLACATCHTGGNVWVGGTRIVTIPGNPKWGLAPASMAWQGKSLGEICRQIKDPARNGGRTLAQVQDHMAHDGLVAWGWAPGAGRTPAPGTQEQLGQLVQAWIDTGAQCPAAGGPKIPTHDIAAGARPAEG